MYTYLNKNKLLMVEYVEIQTCALENCSGKTERFNELFNQSIGENCICFMLLTYKNIKRTANVIFQKLLIIAQTVQHRARCVVNSVSMFNVEFKKCKNVQAALFNAKIKLGIA